MPDKFNWPYIKKLILESIVLCGKIILAIFNFLSGILVDFLRVIKTHLSAYETTDAVRILLAFVILVIFLTPALYISVFAFEHLMGSYFFGSEIIEAPSKLTTLIFKFADSDETTYGLYTSIGMPIIVAYFGAEESRRGKSTAALFIFLVLIIVFVCTYFPSLATQDDEWGTFIEGLSESLSDSTGDDDGPKRILLYIEGVRQVIITTLAALAGIKIGAKA